MEIDMGMDDDDKTIMWKQLNLDCTDENVVMWLTQFFKPKKRKEEVEEEMKNYSK